MDNVKERGCLNIDTKGKMPTNAQLTLGKNVTASREQRIADIKTTPCWDLVIIGGGITGAGILKLASQMGLKVLLLEQKDFAWGSSSRSSKMVHGGLRYLAQGQVSLTKESVIERQRLLQDGTPLIAKQSFVMSHYQHQFPAPWIFNGLLSCYDLITGIKQHKFWPKRRYLALAPKVDEKKLLGGTQFFDALTDDARLVLRLVQESLQRGGQALNYAKVTHLKNSSAVKQVMFSLSENDNKLIVNAKVVVNACGAWSNLLPTSHDATDNNCINKKPALYMRPLRGSHLIIANWRLPVASVISIPHPEDKRPVQIYPWQNVTIVGTTDVEHKQNMAEDAKINQAEFDYLLMAINQQFPGANISEKDIISTFAGVRPLTTSDPFTEPSKEKREHHIEQEGGVVSITGGKLTTFRLIAEQALKLVCEQLKVHDKKDYQQVLTSCCQQAIFSTAQEDLNSVEHQAISQQIKAYYGEFSQVFIENNEQQYFQPVRYSRHLWAELIWAVKYEQVQHLDDLLLRRTRLGNVLPNGAMELLPKIKKLCQPYLSWNEEKWQQETARYRDIWQMAYSLPISEVPDNS